MSAFELQIVNFGLRIDLLLKPAIYNPKSAILKMAERVGFEPTLGFPKHAFQACAFSRSATSPLTSGQSTQCRVQGEASLLNVYFSRYSEL